MIEIANVNNNNNNNFISFCICFWFFKNGIPSYVIPHVPTATVGTLKIYNYEVFMAAMLTLWTVENSAEPKGY